MYRRGEAGSLERFCEFERNYDLLQTFEPFRQGNRDFALIPRDYEHAAVLDLQTGEVIAEETESYFFPVGFYVPDWWDIHDGSIIPGSYYWNRDREWPVGDFGFVWGCIWGDDHSWKVQYLDLSRIQQGVINRQERFGYVELATFGYENPCFIPEADLSRRSAPPTFIHVDRDEGAVKVEFSVRMEFDLSSGKSADWRRITDDDPD